MRVANNTVPAGNQITNTASKTNFADGWYLPTNTDNGSNTGRVFRIKLFGYLSTKASSPGTLTLALNVGATQLVATAAIALPAGLANAGFMVDLVAILCTSGTSGLWSAQGFALLDNAGAPVSAGMVNAGLTTTGQIAVNTNTAATLQLSAQFSVADVGNIITATQIVIVETP
jgi:hypothetical protein